MLKVLYEDNHVIVVVKPFNVPSQEDKTGDKDMLNLVKDYIKQKYNKPGNVYVGLVHRLDRPVGGVMVFAKTSKSASRLSESIRNKSFEKTYLAVVNGSFENQEGRFEDYLWKDEALNKSMVVSSTKHGAKLSKLSYEVLKTENNYSLVRVHLETGRHHQIRVQFANSGHSLYGDQKYGKGPKDKQIALWAYKVTFKHPVKDEEMTFEALPSGSFGIFKDLDKEIK